MNDTLRRRSSVAHGARSLDVSVESCANCAVRSVPGGSWLISATFASKALSQNCP